MQRTQKNTWKYGVKIRGAVMQLQKYQSFQWNWSLFILLGLGLLGLGVKTTDISQILDFAATGLLIGGGTMIVLGLFYTLPISNSLVIEEDGFSYRAGWRRVFCRWEECSEFSPKQKNLLGLIENELVTFDSENPAALSKSGVKITGEITDKTTGNITGKNVALPGTFGLCADELAEKMNHFRQMQIRRQQKPFQTFL